MRGNILATYQGTNFNRKVASEFEGLFSHLSPEMPIFRQFRDFTCLRKFTVISVKQDFYINCLEAGIMSFEFEHLGSTGLWITQRSIPMAGWCSPSATVRKSAQRFESGGQVPEDSRYPARCFNCENTYQPYTFCITLS